MAPSRTRWDPTPGLRPSSSVPSISATAITPQLLITRWLMFVAVMVAIGLFVLRIFITRARWSGASPGVSLRAAPIAFVVGGAGA